LFIPAVFFDLIAGYGPTVEEAVKSGVRLFDSGNWHDGLCESVLGNSLQAVYKKQLITREDIILLSKTDQLTSDSLDTSLKRLKTPYLDSFLLADLKDVCFLSLT
jgi:diketogulonate reductase-like aldo/keto reductase